MKEKTEYAINDKTITIMLMLLKSQRWLIQYFV